MPCPAPPKPHTPTRPTAVSRLNQIITIYQIPKSPNSKGPFGIWRRERDSNPRYVTVYTLSRRAPSTTRTPLQKFSIVRESGVFSTVSRKEHAGVLVTPGILPFAPSGPAFGCSDLFRTNQSTTIPDVLSFTLRAIFATLRCSKLIQSILSDTSPEIFNCPRIRRVQHGFAKGARWRARYSGHPALRPFGASLRLF